MLGLALPHAIEFLPVAESQLAYRDGFRFSAMAVVLIMMSGSLVAAFQQGSLQRSEKGDAAPQGAGDR